MAGTLLHVTLADRFLDGAQRREASDAVRAWRHDFRLGAVFVDLPYFDRLWLNGLRAAVDRPLVFDAWGGAIHARSPAMLALSLLRAATTGGERAFALGHLTHVAVDLAFHPHIAVRVDAAAVDPMERDTLHKRIEDALDHRCHVRLLGHAGVGHPYAARALSIFPSRGWTHLPSLALGSLGHVVPSAGRFGAWLRALRLFGLASASRLAPWVPSPPPRDPAEDDLALALAKDALARCDAYVEAGFRLLDGSLDEAGFLSRIPNLSLLDGSAAIFPRPATPR